MTHPDPTTNSAPDSLHHVVVNQEDQYSLWPAAKECPAGWKTVGEARTKADCLAYIKEVWVDMRPRSLREQMDKPAA